MNHYPHHIGDYLKDTAHLDPLEDGIYRRMLDLYYTLEGPLEAHIAGLCRRLRLDARKHGATVTLLLGEFFQPNDQGTHWHHTRCDLEIAKYQEKAAANRKNGKAGGRPKQTQQEPNNNPDGYLDQTQNNLNQNQNQNQNRKPEPVEKRSQGSRLLLDKLPDDWRAFCQAERTDLDPERTFAKFSDYWKAQPGKRGTKLDWFATWRNWVREERKVATNGSGKFNVQAASRKKLADALASEAMGDGPPQEVFPALPPEVH